MRIVYGFCIVMLGASLGLSCGPSAPMPEFKVVKTRDQPGKGAIKLFRMEFLLSDARESSQQKRIARSRAVPSDGMLIVAFVTSPDGVQFPSTPFSALDFPTATSKRIIAVYSKNDVNGSEQFTTYEKNLNDSPPRDE